MKRGLDALGRVSCGALGEVLLGRREGGERRERSECSEGRSRQGGMGGRGQGRGGSGRETARKGGMRQWRARGGHPSGGMEEGEGGREGRGKGGKGGGEARVREGKGANIDTVRRPEPAVALGFVVLDSRERQRGFYFSGLGGLGGGAERRI